MATPQQCAAAGLNPVPDLLTVPNLSTPVAGADAQSSVSAGQAAQEFTINLDGETWELAESEQPLDVLETEWKAADNAIRSATERLRSFARIESPDARWFSENVPLFHTVLKEIHDAIMATPKLPAVQAADSGLLPRSYAVADNFLHTGGYTISKETLVPFLQRVQVNSPFQMTELWTIKPFMELALVERIGELGKTCDPSPQPKCQSAAVSSDAELTLPQLCACLKNVVEFNWEDIFEQVSVTETILRLDPLQAYHRMDPESRGLYCNALAELAAHSPRTEQEIARTAVQLAREPHLASTERAEERRSHVGYYLIGEGKSALKRAIGYKASLSERAQELILEFPTTFYFTAIGVLTLAVMALFVAIPGFRVLRWYEAALIFLPAFECAVATVNLFTTMIVPPRKLARFDFSEGIPRECTTLVVIPMLLTSEEQAKQAARDLEIRYLANRDANLHFALLTDPPDSVQEFDDKDALAPVCSRIIADLNKKYTGDGKGSFYHFHRNRTYNESEQTWMGWERKRGKLLNLNNLLMGKCNDFSVTSGDLSILPVVRYVITLDLDTQLPRDSARKLVGAIAHPLNRAVINPETNTVVEGYGVLQPRVEISVKSKNRSRLAGIFSGDAGLDIYTRAISDVYQDLFGEGIFTGKGIYEVETFQQVLDLRFPCNAVLSHDLLEGIYTRVGLMTDVEVIDDYPSHVSAYSRRKHRWVRGDWQIIRWLLPRVPNRAGNLVHNPLSDISRWKIVDNLRRSLTEFGFFALLLCGWLVLPGKALYWTLATVFAISLPVFVQFAVSLIRAAGSPNFGDAWKNIRADFSSQLLAVVFRIALLFHQSLVTLDAIVRTIIRMTFTRKRLLQWETAADSESSNSKKTPVEMYLTWTPWICFVLDLVIVVVRPSSLLIALPFLALWGCSKTICEWLNMPYWTSGNKINEKDRTMLRSLTLRTWRFFREFSNEQENWLIPDIVHENDDSLLAHRISPTNIGFLLNSRLAAFDLGWSTLTEFVGDVEKTCDTINRMPKRNGDFYNWYDTQSLQPVSPLFISTVDNGNLVCCLWTLKQACLEAPKEPLFRNVLLQGISDHLETILDVLVQNKRHHRVVFAIQRLKFRLKSFTGARANWLDELPNVAQDISKIEQQLSDLTFGDEVAWWTRELSTRITALQNMLYDFAPWLLPAFAKYRTHFVASEKFKLSSLTLEALPEIHASIRAKAQELIADPNSDEETRSAMELLLSSLSRATSIVESAAGKLAALATTADAIAAKIDFAFLYNPEKRQISIGYDADNNFRHQSHYDLLASEARAAVFVAIAKGDIPQITWFNLGRPRRTYKNAAALLSWTGTMFEYLLPPLWMRNYPNTLLEESSKTAVRAQQAYALSKSVPWGISECSCSERNPDNHYRYHAFGLPNLALSHSDGDDLVISPYSAFLALLVDAPNANKNIREMRNRGWVGAQGFYDACDFTPSRMKNGETSEIVRCWMAHHQGMILVAAATVLCDMSMQRRFHAEPMVAATERLLQEKIPRTPALELDIPEHEAEVPTTPANPPERALQAAG
ncbi:MAG: glucoamylase family protein [Candidatus Acidiferrum sp.]